MYRAVRTCRNVAVAAIVFATQVEYIGEQHLMAVKHVLRYLRGTKSRQLHWIKDKVANRRCILMQTGKPGWTAMMKQEIG